MEPRSQIYIAGALTSARQKDIQIYETIDRVCSEAGYSAYLPHRDTGPRNNVLDPPEVFLKNTQALQTSVAIIAEVSSPSLGVGMECEYALRSGIPLISVARMDVEVSRMLQGHPAVNDLIRYSDDEDLRQVLLKRLGNLHKPPRRPGLFIAFEGMDGTGKSTLAKACWERYSKRFEGRSVTLISDPPSLPPWDKVREIFSEANALTAQSEAILLLAARVDQANRAVVPVLQRDGLVFADRYHDSWLIYQGERLQEYPPHATPNRIDYFLNLATAVVKSLAGLILPDHVFVLTADPEILFQRIQARGRAQDKYETPQFATRIRDRYISLYERNSTRMTLIDTTRRSFEDVEAMVIDYIDNYIIVEACHE